MHRAVSGRIKINKWAERAGRFVGSLGRGLPGVAAALFACAGFGMIYRPLAFLTAAVFLLMVDRRVP